MKRTHKMELAGKTYSASLSFATSLAILEEIESPSKIYGDILTNAALINEGQPPVDGFRFDEASAAKMLEIILGPGPNHGELMIEEGIWMTYAKLTQYLGELVQGRSKEIKTKPDDEEEGDPEGN